MNKSYVLTHRHRPNLLFTFGVDSVFLDVLNSLYVEMSELSQEELETFLGILSVLHPEITVKSAAPPSEYVLRYM